MLWVASVEYTVRDLLFAVEYSRLAGEDGEQQPWRWSRELDLQRAGLRAGLVPGEFLGSRRAPTTRSCSPTSAGGAPSTVDSTMPPWTLRFDINRFWLVKLEGHTCTAWPDFPRA